MDHSWISANHSLTLAQRVSHHPHDPHPQLEPEETFWSMTKHIVTIAVPTILGQVFSLLVVAVNIAFIGQLGNTEMLAGAGLGTLYVNIFCQSIILGLNGAVATLVAQSYGAQNYKKCGDYLNRGRVVSFIAFIPIIVVLLLCEQFLLLIGMDPQASHYAGVYTYVLIPAMFFHSQFDANRQYLNAMHKANVVMVTMIVTSALHLGWCYLFVNHLNWGVIGASVATLVTYFSNFMVITLYCMYNKEVKRCFFFFNKDSFKELGAYLKIGIPSTIMLCLEWWSFEVLAFMAGYISVQATGAHVIVLNTHVVVIMVPLGAQVAAIVCVGNAIGEGNHKKADYYFKLVALYSFILDSFLAVTIYYCKEGLARLYTSEETLIPLVTGAYDVMLLILLLHGMAMVQAGAVRGLGMLEVGSYMVLFAFYVVSLPLAYLFAFVIEMGMKGLWWGVVAGSASEVVLYFIFLRFLCDWKKIAFEISNQLNEHTPNISFHKSDQIHEQLLGNKQDYHSSSDLRQTTTEA